jgi:hypothetical protein
MTHNKKAIFCTLFDKNYLPHVLVLTDSLEKHVTGFVIYCFCMDEESFLYLEENNRPGVICISHTMLEDRYPELLLSKSNRSKIEYYFTCTASICSYIFDSVSSVDLLTYLDADLCFYSSPEPIFDELKTASVGIIEHKFYSIGKVYEKYGKFNVGWVSFRNDLSGRKCLEDWRRDCIEWCYDRLENGKFADQKYLDYWVTKYTGVYVIQHLGANLAPWNVGNYHLTFAPDKKSILVEGQNLIFYHFAMVKQLDSLCYITNVSRFFVKLTGIVKNNIYLPYVLKLREYNARLNKTYIKKDRKDITKSNLINKIRYLTRKIRQVVYRDYIKISL